MRISLTIGRAAAAKARFVQGYVPALFPVMGAVLGVMILSACSPTNDKAAEQANERTFAAYAVNEQTPAALRFNWHYQRFLEQMVNESGRVIDNSYERSISTSEGQAYGMWFALLAQDKTHFELMLTWADKNLAQGALGDKLPAWLWGEDEDGRWHILDDNPASDADIWMVYALYAASERWQAPRYAAIAERLSRRLLETTTFMLGTNSDSEASTEDKVEGLVLLPAPYGFTHENYIMVNPSYFNLVQLRGLAAYSGDERWQEIYQTSVQIMQQLANEKHGMIPDWLTLNHSGHLLSVRQTAREHQDYVRYGEYDAIRTYMWLAQEAQVAGGNSELLLAFKGMHEVVAEQGFPPERLSRPVREFIAHPDNPNTGINIIEGASGRGNIGFSAVLLPYLAMLEGVHNSLGAESHKNVREQMARIVAAHPDDYRDWYYTQMLLMFGLSALQCNEFQADGRLVVSQEVLNGCA